MEQIPSVRIIRSTVSVDVGDLKEQLEILTSAVTIETERPAIQMGIAWSLPSVVEIQLAYVLVEPFLRKAVDVLSEAVAEKGAEKVIETVGSTLVSVFRRAIKFISRRGASGPTAPAPPLRITFDIVDKALTEPTSVSLVFPDDLTDEQVRAGVASAARAKEMAEQQVKRHGKYQRRMQQLIQTGKKELADKLILSGEYGALRSKNLFYVYRPEEEGWMDLNELVRREAEKHIGGAKDRSSGDT
jgi:hypothetical protein